MENKIFILYGVDFCDLVSKSCLETIMSSNVYDRVSLSGKGFVI